jgi:hypothetical protein
VCCHACSLPSPCHPVRHPSWRRWLLQQPHRRWPQPLPEHDGLLDTSRRGAIQRPLVRIVALHVPTMECEAHEAFYVPWRQLVLVGEFGAVSACSVPSLGPDSHVRAPPYDRAKNWTPSSEPFGWADKPAEKYCWLICCERKILFRLKKTSWKRRIISRINRAFVVVERGQVLVKLAVATIRSAAALPWFIVEPQVAPRVPVSSLSVSNESMNSTRNHGGGTRCRRAAPLLRMPRADTRDCLPCRRCNLWSQHRATYSNYFLRALVITM